MKFCNFIAANHDHVITKKNFLHNQTQKARKCGDTGSYNVMVQSCLTNSFDHFIYQVKFSYYNFDLALDGRSGTSLYGNSKGYNGNVDLN